MIREDGVERRRPYDKGRERLRQTGAHENDVKLHSCFGEDGKLQVFDVWESQEAFDEFLTYLGPVMAELGIEVALTCLIDVVVRVTSGGEAGI